MAISKITLNGVVQMDVTQKTVTPNTMLDGTTALKNDGTDITGRIAIQGAQTIHPSAEEQSISGDVYLTGSQTIAPVTTTNLNANNIRRGVTVKVGDADDPDRVASIQGVMDVDVVVDPTLSVPGEAADAEKTGDVKKSAAHTDVTMTTAVPDSTNYNMLQTPGNYRVSSGSSAGTMTNCPTNKAHRLFVVTQTGAARIVQIVMASSIPVTMYMRYYNGTSWGAWGQVLNVVPPSADGTYTLQCTVSSGTPTYSWVTA